MTFIFQIVVVLGLLRALFFSDVLEERTASTFRATEFVWVDPEEARVKKVCRTYRKGFGYSLSPIRVIILLKQVSHTEGTST